MVEVGRATGRSRAAPGAAPTRSPGHGGAGARTTGRAASRRAGRAVSSGGSSTRPVDEDEAGQGQPGVLGDLGQRRQRTGLPLAEPPGRPRRRRARPRGRRRAARPSSRPSSVQRRRVQLGGAAAGTAAASSRREHGVERTAGRGSPNQRSRTWATPSSSLLAVTSSAASSTSGWALATATSGRPRRASAGRWACRRRRHVGGGDPVLPGHPRQPAGLADARRR